MRLIFATFLFGLCGFASAEHAGFSQRPGAKEDMVTAAEVGNLEVNKECLSKDKRSIYERLKAGQSVPFDELTSELIAPDQVPLLTRLWQSSRVRGAKAPTDLLGVKDWYEEGLHPRRGFNWDGSRPISYHGSSRSLTALARGRNVLNDYSGTVLHQYFSRRFLGSKRFAEQRPVIIYENGHMLPGYMVPEGEGFRLIGLETTALGPAKIDYGLTADLPEDSIKVVRAEDWILVELFKNCLIHPRAYAEEKLRIAAETYRVPNRFQLQAGGDASHGFAFEASPFSFGVRVEAFLGVDYKREEPKSIPLVEMEKSETRDWAQHPSPTLRKYPPYYSYFQNQPPVADFTVPACLNSAQVSIVEDWARGKNVGTSTLMMAMARANSLGGPEPKEASDFRKFLGRKEYGTLPVHDYSPEGLKQSFDEVVGREKCSYDPAATSLTDICWYKSLNAHSGTAYFLFLSHEILGHAALQKLHPVVIFEDGHELPGFMVPEGKHFRLIGVETTTRDGGLLDFGLTKDLPENQLKVVRADDWLISESFNNCLKDPKAFAENALKKAADQYQIYNSFQLAAGDIVEERQQGFPFAFGTPRPGVKITRETMPTTTLRAALPSSSKTVTRSQKLATESKISLP